MSTRPERIRTMDHTEAHYGGNWINGEVFVSTDDHMNSTGYVREDLYNKLSREKDVMLQQLAEADELIEQLAEELTSLEDELAILSREVSYSKR